LDALRLSFSEDGDFLCERCNVKLDVVESDQLAAQEGGDGDGDENARRRRREKLKDMLQKMEVLI
jgi:transcription initiation factor TFIIE subunit alpha